MLSVCRFAGLPVCRFAFIITVVGASFRSDDRERADSPRWVEAMRAFFSRGQARSSYSHVRRLASTARPQLSSVDANALLGDDEVKQFRRDGAICVRQVFDAAWVAALREAADVNMASPGPLCDEHAEAQGTTGRFHDDQFLWRRHAAFEQFVWRSGAGALAARAMGSRSAHIFYDQLLVKEPGTVAATPWHNDTSYWQLRGSMICSVWVTLDDVAAANGVSYVRGSKGVNDPFFSSKRALGGGGGGGGRGISRQLWHRPSVQRHRRATRSNASSIHNSIRSFT